MKRLVVVALTVLGLCVAAQSVPLQAQKAKTMTASGTVKAVTGTSLQVTAAGGKDMTFALDNTTKFVGKGLSTKTREKGGKGLSPSEAVAMGDSVTVTYHDMAGTMHAAQVRVNNKAMTTKK